MPNGNYEDIYRGLDQTVGGLFTGGTSDPYGQFDFDKWWEWLQQQQGIPDVRFPGISTGIPDWYKRQMSAAGRGGSPWLGYKTTVPIYEKELMSYLIGEPILSKGGMDPFGVFGGGGGGGYSGKGPPTKGAAWGTTRTTGATRTGAVDGKGGVWTGLQPWAKGPRVKTVGTVKGFGFPRNVSPWSILNRQQREFLLDKWAKESGAPPPPTRGLEHFWRVPGPTGGIGGGVGSRSSDRPELQRASPYLRRRIGEYEMGVMGPEEKRTRLEGIEAAIAQKTLGLPEPERRKAITQAMADGVMKLDIEGVARENRNMQYILQATTGRISQLQGAIQLAQGWQSQALNDASQAKNRAAQMSTAALSATTQKDIAKMQGQISVQKTNLLKAMSERQMTMDWLQFLLQLQYGYWNTQQQLEANEVPGWLQAIIGIGQVAGTAGAIIGAFSSKEFKTDIETIGNATEKVNRLRGVSFKWKLNNQPNMGLIAEEVLKVVPEAVIYTPDGEVLGLEYSQLIGLLVEAIKEQQGQIEQLKRRI